MFIFTIMCLVISSLLIIGSLLNEKTGMRFASLLFHLPLFVYFIITIVNDLK